MDLSLFLGALGVILTIVFFVIGYRQTIGARRERARAANQALVDTFFRRLALEESFSLSRSDVSKAISGWAINARVRASDIYSLQELEDLLSAKALESDYVAEIQRQTIGLRISRMFGEEKNHIFVKMNEISSNKIGGEFTLAVGSALASMVAATFVSLFIPDKSDIIANNFLESVIVPVTLMIILTATSLLLYTRVKDISRRNKDDNFSDINSLDEFKHAFLLTQKILMIL